VLLPSASRVLLASKWSVAGGPAVFCAARSAAAAKCALSFVHEAIGGSSALSGAGPPSAADTGEGRFHLV